MARWSSYIVVSEKYYSLWACEGDNLVVLTKEAFENIYKDQDNKKSKKKKKKGE